MESSSLPRMAVLQRPLWQRSAAILGGLLLLTQTATAQTAASPVSSVAPTTQATNSLPTLSNGEHQLKGGETQSFRIHLPAGHFLYALIEQLDIDVSAALHGPDGKQVVQTDSPNDRWGFESILLVADTSGDYRVEVRSPNSRASAGRYKITIMAFRVATAIDRDHASAGRAFDEGQKLRAQPTATAKRAALDKYLSAVPLFKNAGDTYRQALTLLSIGSCYAQLNEFRRALPYFDETVALARSLGDARLEAGTETFLGGMRDILGDIGEALSHYKRALKLSRDTGARLIEGNSLNNIGKIYTDLADWQKALEYYGQALTIYKAIDSQQREAIALNNIGVTYSVSGEPGKALEYFQQSLPLLRAGTDRNAESYTMSNIGNAYSRLGEHQTGLDYFAQARAIQQQTGNRALEAETLDLTGVAYSGLGQPTKALEYHQKALEIHRTTGNQRREAMSLNNLGHVYNLLGQPDKALVQLEQALSILRTIGDLNGIAVTLERSARAEQSRGNNDQARKDIEESLDLIETVRTRSGSQQLRASYFASREQAYKFYIDLLMKHGKDLSPAYEAIALRTVERGRARSLLEMLAEATVDIRQGVDRNLIEKEHDLAQLLNAKAQRQIQLLAQKGGKQEIDILKQEISALESEYQQAQIQIRKNSPQYASLTQPQTLTVEEIQQQLDRNTLLLEYSLGEERSFVWAVTPTSLKSYELPGRAQIEKSARRVYELLAARSVANAGETLSEAQTRLDRLDSQLVNTATELSKMILDPIASELHGKRLLIIADGALQYVPFAALSAVGTQPSVVTGDPADKGQPGYLAQRRPVRRSLAAATYRPLVIDHEIVSLPSASALAFQRKALEHRKPAAKAVAVIADPVFSTADERFKSSAGASTKAIGSGDDLTNRIIEHIADGKSGKLAIKRLRFTRQEAYQILAVAPRATDLKALDFDASRAAAIATDLSQYRYVHFATHGYLDSERPDLSAIVLSLVDRQGNPQDGFLRAHDIYNLNLPAELVVLSACQTGLGKEIRGEGLVGLTRGFMYAGARRVVVSLWNVNDKATAELMERFYRGMLKENLTPAAALRRAQVGMSQKKEWHSPYYWAAFVLHGEWK